MSHGGTRGGHRQARGPLLVVAARQAGDQGRRESVARSGRVRDRRLGQREQQVAVPPGEVLALVSLVLSPNHGATG
jgi:hypothetical protein